MVELRNNKNNNNLKKLHEKGTSDNSNSLDLTKCTKLTYRINLEGCLGSENMSRT